MSWRTCLLVFAGVLAFATGQRIWDAIATPTRGAVQGFASVEWLTDASDEIGVYQYDGVSAADPRPMGRLVNSLRGRSWEPHEIVYRSPRYLVTGERFLVFSVNGAQWSGDAAVYALDVSDPPDVITTPFSAALRPIYSGEDLLRVVKERMARHRYDPTLFDDPSNAVRLSRSSPPMALRGEGAGEIMIPPDLLDLATEPTDLHWWWLTMETMTWWFVWAERACLVVAAVGALSLAQAKLRGLRSRDFISVDGWKDGIETRLPN